MELLIYPTQEDSQITSEVKLKITLLEITDIMSKNELLS